jgi:hypothetical protein
MVDRSLATSPATSLGRQAPSSTTREHAAAPFPSTTCRALLTIVALMPTRSRK